MRRIMMAGDATTARAPRGKVAVESIIRPGIKLVDAAMYEAMRGAYLRAVPKAPPGLTLVEIRQRILAEVPESHFPGGDKVSWWSKTVQLDLEKKGVLKRTSTTPLRLYRP